jgi:hypothetical protein
VASPVKKAAQPGRPNVDSIAIDVLQAWEIKRKMLHSGRGRGDTVAIPLDTIGTRDVNVALYLSRNQASLCWDAP